MSESNDNKRLNRLNHWSQTNLNKVVKSHSTGNIITEDSIVETIGENSDQEKNVNNEEEPLSNSPSADDQKTITKTRPRSILKSKTKPININNQPKAIVFNTKRKRSLHDKVFGKKKKNNVTAKLVNASDISSNGGDNVSVFQDPPPDDDGLEGWQWALIIIGGIFALFFIFWIIWYAFYRRAPAVIVPTTPVVTTPTTVVAPACGVRPAVVSIAPEQITRSVPITFDLVPSRNVPMETFTTNGINGTNTVYVTQ